MYHHNFSQNTVYIIIRSEKFIQWELACSQKNHNLPAKKKGDALQHLPLFQDYFIFIRLSVMFYSADNVL